MHPRRAAHPCCGLAGVCSAAAGAESARDNSQCLQAERILERIRKFLDGLFHNSESNLREGFRSARCRRSAFWSACASHPASWRRRRCAQNSAPVNEGEIDAGCCVGVAHRLKSPLLYACNHKYPHASTHPPLQAAIAVFERQGVEADAYVRRRLAELGARAGERLRW